MVIATRLLPMGDRAVLAEVGSLDDVLALHAALAASRVEGVIDLVPAARTVLVHVDPSALTLAAARSWIDRAARETDAAAPVPADAPVVELDVAYDGPDLASTAGLLAIGPGELAERHAAAEWTVAFTGFAPGFAYLVSPAWTFDVPRLASPRTRVPAGAIGLAAGFAGAYPRETPGGWRLIGTTSAALFDPDAAAPALLTPGARVRFVPRATGPATAGASGTGGDASAGSATVGEDAAEAAQRSIRIIEPGLLATIQDLGRPGAASLGVALSGALDRGALRTANRLVGNLEHAAGIEITMGGLRAVAQGDLWFAVTGAWGPILLDGRQVDPYEAHPWAAGAELRVDWFAHGARGFLAIRGGLGGRAVLGSRATDLLAGLGPAPLHAGDAVAVRDEASGPVPVAGIAPWGAPDDADLVVELAPGPRADWFAASALVDLYESVWTVTNDADRVGVRLDGPVLERVRHGELPSEGMAVGALQVPPTGRPTILLMDGPVTGGYPVIAVVTDAALDAIAQARPGTRIRFRHARAN
ncbi:urea amidolyase family protein [Microbacterium sp. SS28]|uniref:5-oxoprolinase subunit B/C family protein n=1 Tax=Microbacterium sp. SS28 TaxID=2919948 RepID=UPI001FA9FBFA|nr:urea amidolyase family protein [Microbacterium sp. SS28]